MINISKNYSKRFRKINLAKETHVKNYLLYRRNALISGISEN